jgi:hypothetical protein
MATFFNRVEKLNLTVLPLPPSPITSASQPSIAVFNIRYINTFRIGKTDKVWRRKEGQKREMLLLGISCFLLRVSLS